MNQMQPNSIASRCMRILAEGPATSAEVAAELGMTSHLAGTHLRNLWLKGKISRAEYIRKRGPGRQLAFIWSLPATDKPEPRHG